MTLSNGSKSAVQFLKIFLRNFQALLSRDFKAETTGGFVNICQCVIDRQGMSWILYEGSIYCISLQIAFSQIPKNCTALFEPFGIQQRSSKHWWQPEGGDRWPRDETHIVLYGSADDSCEETNGMIQRIQKLIPRYTQVR